MLRAFHVDLYIDKVLCCFNCICEANSNENLSFEGVMYMSIWLSFQNVVDISTTIQSII
uniref:Uncharacterized protein n=1 Tax=Arundo donax TaxID=35708 RepID=A0A0A9ABM8_ARUDO